MRTGLRLVSGAALAALLASQAPAVEGTGLFFYRWTQTDLQNNEGVWVSDFGTGTVTKLWGRNGTGEVLAAAFSPDGLRIAFASGDKLHMMYNNGAREGIVALPDRCRPEGTLCWATSGLFWIDNTYLYRLNLADSSLTRIYQWNDMISGSSKGYWCSQDGLHAWAWNELDDGTPQDTHGDQSWMEFNTDFSVLRYRRLAEDAFGRALWGHGNYITHDGLYMLFDRWDMSPSHQKILKVRFADATVVDTLWCQLPDSA